MTPNRCLLLSIIVMLLIAMPRQSMAYNEDVHFNLTYVLCRMAGISRWKATAIADADWSMDLNDTTTAFKSDPDMSFIDATKYTWNNIKWQRNGIQWHSFYYDIILHQPIKDDAKKRTTVTKRLADLKDRAFNLKGREDDNKVLRPEFGRMEGVTLRQLRQLVYFGQYLHFRQDYFSHREMNKQELTSDRWIPYGGTLGHALQSSVPDCVPARLELAKHMAQESYKDIRDFAANVLQLKVTTNKSDEKDEKINAVIAKLVECYGKCLYRDKARTAAKATSRVSAT